jgi:hypothetical protein
MEYGKLLAANLRKMMRREVELVVEKPVSYLRAAIL